jgi:flagellar hook protein FlgE
MGSSEALNSAISGLQSDSTWLDVIGNNISNSSTIGFKSSSVSFANLFNQSLFSGSADNSSAELGGVNPESIGTGTRVQAIQANFIQGTTQQTGISTDISIQGNGFLVTKSGGNTNLTRAGNLTFDSQGYLVDSTGALVQGYTATTQYKTFLINSALNDPFSPPAPAVALSTTTASLVVNSSDPSAIGNIQINPNMTIPPRSTTQITFQGNLDAAQQATSSGGIFNMVGAAGPVLPIAATMLELGTANTVDPDRMLTTPPIPPGPLPPALPPMVNFNFTQTANLSEQIGGQPVPLNNGFLNLTGAQAFAGNYAWEQQPPLPPATQMSETVYDSTGTQHTITIQFYQVNDIGSGGINAANGPSQACYAWYAFDTTGAKTVSTANLLGGTGIGEGDFETGNFFQGYDRGSTTAAGQNFLYGGDFLYFNTDGSLASSGGIGGPPSPPGPPNIMSIPRIYLPNDDPTYTSAVPTNGAEITVINLDFGTFGVLGVGRRDGLTGDAQGSYQTLNGVNTYVPDSHATATQNGYADGTLQSLEFNQTGTIVGSFTNGQKADLAQVVLASVSNEGGLSNVGNNDFQASINSGSVQLGLAGQNGLGTIEGDSLEGSNVDLTVELSNMIVAQRGFDTNARVIAAVNSELQTVTQLGQ